MIRVSVFYPNREGGRFDMDYYVKKHMPMVRQKLGAAVKGMTVEQGLSGGAPGTPATYVAVGQMLCDSVEAFQAASSLHMEAIMADVPNYTNLQPIIQIGEVKM